jgi:ABC-type bacteriocin/lantibiotic exporter with double-glycine peptidase domain
VEEIKKKIFWSCLILFLAIVALLGCVTGPPVKNPQITKSNLPQKHFIENVPIYRQTYMDCGPTSIRMILNFYGKNYSQEEIVKARKGRGTGVSDMESYARTQGFEVHPFYDWKKEEMKYLLAQGYPLIAVGMPPPEWSKSGRYLGEGHYVVLVGYDDLKKIFTVHDPSPGRRMQIPYDVFKDFHRSHPTHSNYVLCIYPKSK